MMKHVMIDIETLGTDMTSVIISIAAVRFDIKTGEIGDYMNVNIDPNDCLNQGFTLSWDTIKWWMSQNDEAKKSLLSDDRVTLSEALMELYRFIYMNVTDVEVWGNGSTFDISTLEYAYSKLGMSKPWKYVNVRDVRTMVMLAPDIKREYKFDGVKHDPLHDAYFQIGYLCEIYKTIMSARLAVVKIKPSDNDDYERLEIWNRFLAENSVGEHEDPYNGGFYSVDIIRDANENDLKKLIIKK